MAIQATKHDVVLSGHGAVEVGKGETTVPAGFELVVLAPPGATISDRLGGLIENGKSVGALKLSTGTGGVVEFKPVVYGSGKSCPNYVLSAPRGLALKPGVPHMLGVEGKTELSSLWQRVEVFRRVGETTRVYWCACAAMQGAKNQMVDAA